MKEAVVQSLLPLAIVLLCAHRACYGKPVMNGLPRGATVGEAETEARVIYVVDDITYTGTYDCRIGGGADGRFEVAQNPTTGFWELRSLATPDFETDKIYKPKIRCEDDNGNEEHEVWVRTVPGESVSDCTQTVTNVDALGTDASEIVATASCTSDNGHTIVYNMTTQSFFFKLDHITGDIVSMQPLGAIDAGTSSVSLAVTCHDLYDDIFRYCDIGLVFTNQNTVPSTSVLPLSDSQSEDLPSGSALFTLTNDDPDGQVYTYKYFCTPDGIEDLFEFNDATQVFSLASDKTLSVDASPITCDFYIKDPYVEAGPFTYELTVTDVNEAPVCDGLMYYGTLTEETAGGSQFTNAGISCTDPDPGDTLTFALTSANGSSLFNINSATAAITSSTTYDADTQGYERILGVLCIDSGGALGPTLTGTCYVTITIEDVNDNRPVLGTTSLVVYITDSTPLGSVIGSIGVSDADDGDNGLAECTGVSTAEYADHIWIGPDCKVYLVKRPKYPYWPNDTRIPYDVSATDKGSPALTSITGSLEVIYMKTRTHTTPPPVTGSFWSYNKNYAVLAGAIVTAAMLLTLMAFCCIKYYCGLNCLFGQLCEECRNNARNRHPRHNRRLDESYYKRENYSKDPYDHERDPYRDEKDPYRNEKDPYRNDKDPYRDERDPYRDDKDPYRNDTPNRSTIDRHDRYPEPRRNPDPRRMMTLSERVALREPMV